MDLVEGPKENLRVKNIALMLFSYQPEKFFPGTQVDIVIYPKGKDADPDNFIEIDPIKGPVHQIIRRTLDYIKTMVIRQKVAKVSIRAEADRTYNYPYQALEEIIVNALYHRSYQEREPVEISIMPEQIEVISYSGADRSIKLEDLRAGKRVHARRYRNRRLGDFLKELDLTEGRGTGIPTVKKELKNNGSDEASYESDDDRTYFYVSIPCHKDFVCKELAIHEDGHIRERKLTTATAVDIRKQIFELIVSNVHITRRELSDIIGINQSAIQKHIEVLINNGNIENKSRTHESYIVILKKL
jgi:ATP-dependent DNA helicase RecG